jgi:hypothetical protein
MNCPLITATGVVPQQYAAPLGVTPQVCSPPALTDANVSPPDTATGVALFVVVPVPNWP